MKITFQMSEMLVLSSVMLYSQNKILAMIILSLGIMGAVVKFSIENTEKEKKVELQKNLLESFQTMIGDIFNKNPSAKSKLH